MSRIQNKLARIIAKKNTKLDKMLKMAHIKQTPEEFVSRALMLSAYIAIAFMILLFMLFDKTGVFLGWLFFWIPLIYIATFWFFMNTPLVYIRRREREINKEVLFAGRYILVKLDSGVPLYNAFIDASKGYGIANKYFKEIVDDINLGTPIEKALENARENSPSKYFKIILSELITSLKTGVDISVPLRNVLDQITKEQIMEVKQYSKKLGALMLFYVVVGAVLPSLGMTMFIVMSGFMGLDVGGTVVFLALTMLAFIQYMFIAIFKSIRPMVNI